MSASTCSRRCSPPRRALGVEMLAARILGDVAGRVASGDDIAFLIVRACGVPERMDIEIPGDPALLAGLRGRLRRWLELRGLGEQEREDAVLSISEACNNAIEHAYGGAPGAIRLTLDHRAEALEITVEDHGSWRTPTLDPERGRGLEIMRCRHAGRQHRARIRTHARPAQPAVRVVDALSVPGLVRHASGRVAYEDRPCAPLCAFANEWLTNPFAPGCSKRTSKIAPAPGATLVVCTPESQVVTSLST